MDENLLKGGGRAASGAEGLLGFNDSTPESLARWSLGWQVFTASDLGCTGTGVLCSLH